MKSIVLVLVCIALAIAGSARGAEGEGAEEAVFPLVIFSDEMKVFAEALRSRTLGVGSGEWRECGNYLAVNYARGAEILRFGFQRVPPSNDLVQVVLSTTNIIVVSIDEKAATPALVIRGEQPEQFILRMNSEDYKTVLPCLSRGVGT